MLVFVGVFFFGGSSDDVLTPPLPDFTCGPPPPSEVLHLSYPIF